MAQRKSNEVRGKRKHNVKKYSRLRMAYIVKISLGIIYAENILIALKNNKQTWSALYTPRKKSL
jgi:hypothetical protein